MLWDTKQHGSTFKEVALKANNKLKAREISGRTLRAPDKYCRCKQHLLHKGISKGELIRHSYSMLCSKLDSVTLANKLSNLYSVMVLNME